MTKASSKLNTLKNQNAVFLEGEGDQYYRRNQDIDETHIDWPLKMIPEAPRRVLDIGCSLAYRLAAIRKQYGAECVGIDPSKEVVEQEGKKYPDITFLRCFAHDIPIEKPFDLVIAQLVFTWIARDTLLASVAEIDRLCSKYLIVCDFLPDKPMKRTYHHIKDGSVWSYKQDYAQIFLSTGLYKIVKRHVYDYDEFDKGVCTLLQKEEVYEIDDRELKFDVGRRRIEGETDVGTEAVTSTD